MKAENIVVWVNYDTRQVRVRGSRYGRPEADGGHWHDPIGAAYSQWCEMTDDQRVLLMLQTAIDLTMQGFDLGEVLRAFAEVSEFRALATTSYPMCRALTKALTGTCLELDCLHHPEGNGVAAFRAGKTMPSMSHRNPRHLITRASPGS
jgi:hypothetical protein